MSTVARVLRAGVLVMMPGLVAMTAAIPAVLPGPLSFVIRRDFDFPIATIGILITCYYVASAVFAGFGGWLVPRFGTVWPVRIGVFGIAVSCALLATATSAGHLMVIVALAGIVNGVLNPPLNLMIMRLVPERFRGLGFGIKAAGVSAAASLAALGVWAVAALDVSWRSILVSSAVLALVVCALTWTLGSDHGDGIRLRPIRLASSPVVRALPPASLFMLAAGGLLAAAGMTVFAPFLIESLRDSGMPTTAAAGVFALGSWLGVFARIVLGGLSDRWRDPLAHLWFVVGMNAVSAVCMLGLAWAHVDALLILATVVGFTLGTAWPGLIHHAVIVTHTESQALATSWMQTGTYTGAVFGPVIFGVLAQDVSFALAWEASAGAVLVAAATMSAGILLVRRRRLRQYGID